MGVVVHCDRFDRHRMQSHCLVQLDNTAKDVGRHVVAVVVVDLMLELQRQQEVALIK